MGPTGKYTTLSAQASMLPAEPDEDGGSECTSTCMDLAEIVFVGADPDGVPRCADEVERSSP